MLAYYEDVLALAHAYPMICVYDDEGWNEELPAQYGDIVYADMSFYIVRVSAPKDLTLVTSGRRIASDEAGQDQTIVVASGPARDFFMAASPRYQELTRRVGEVTIRSYASRASAAGSQFTLDTAADALQAFGKRVAPYPYSELDFVATPNLALGIEYPGAIALTIRTYEVGTQPRGSADAAVLESTVAHEVAHQIFYNLVGNDQLDDPWLDEALAQYLTLQYYNDIYGGNAGQGFHAYLNSRWEKVGFAKIPIGLPVAAYQPEEYGPIVYGRGPLFVAALQEQMGAPAFDAFLQEYSESLSWDIATPQAFQSLAEKHCACDLDALFQEWVYP
jgi:aminopeptidase N